MNERTIYKKDDHTVIVSPCRTYIHGKLKNFKIEGTDRYFFRQNTAIKAAHELLMKLTLDDAAFNKRKANETRLRNAKKVVNVHKCWKETAEYIKRWDGVLYIETKKNLCKELTEKLDAICKKYRFKNAHAAIGFIQRDELNKKRKLRRK